MKKLVLALLLIATLLCAVSCGGEKTPDVPKFDAVELAGWQDYTIVYPDEVDSALSEAFGDLSKAISKKYGVTLKLNSDFIIPSETVPVGTLEILVGATNRPESANAIALIKSEDFIITQENNRLVIAGGNSSSTVKAVQFYTAYMLGANGLQFPEEAVIVNEKYPLDKLTIGGVDVSEFVIVRGTNLSTLDRSLISLLQRKISLLCGVNVPCVAASTAEQKYEIIFGKTNREVSKFADMPEGTASFRQTEDKLAFYGNGENSNGAMVKYLISMLDEIEGGKSYDIALEDFEAQPYTLAHLTGVNIPAALSNNTGAYDPDFYADARNVIEKFEYSVGQLPDEITVLDPYEVENFVMLSSHTVFVAVDGDDNNAGTIDAPVATITAAAKKLGSGGGIIYLRGGAYDTTNMDAITVKGSVISPVFIMPYQDEEVSLSAGKQIPSSAFKPLDPNDAVGARIPEKSKANVVYVNVFDLGWTKDDIGSISESSSPSLYINNTTGVISRFPNADEDLLYFTKVYETGSVTGRDVSDLYAGWIKRVQNWDAWKKAGGTASTSYTFDRGLYKNLKEAVADAQKLDTVADTAKPDSYGNLNLDMGWSIKMEDLTPFRDNWVNTGDIWFYGNTYSGYRYETCLVEFDKAQMAITSAHGVTHGAATSTNSPTGYNNYYLFNIIEALDKAGEWYLDKATGNLYVYKTDDFGSGDITYCAKTTNILQFTNCENVIVDDLTIKFGGARGVQITKSENVVIQRCSISQTESNGIRLDDSTECAIIYNDVFDTGDSQIHIYVVSTNMKNCTLTRHVVQNNYIHTPRYSVKTGISVDGFQCVASHNYLVDCGFYLGSSYDSIIEYNNVEGGSLDVLDGGLIYLGGFGTYGNHIRYNYLHSWNAPNTGIYFDCLSSFNYAYHNMIDTTEAESSKFRRFLYSSTGHYNVFFGNICVGREIDKILESCLFYDDNSSDGYSFPGYASGFVNSTDSFTNTAFASHYPEVVSYRNLMNQYVTASADKGYKRNELEIYLRSPGSNIIMSNVILGSSVGIESALAKKINDVTGKPATITTITEDNYINTKAADVLKDYANGDFTVLPEIVNRIKEEAPGFKQLSTANVGLTYER